MIIERNFTKYVVFSEDSVLTALNKISDNKARVIFCVSESGIVHGVLTDGDIRRWLVEQKHVDLGKPVSSAMNTRFCSSQIDADPNEISRLFTNVIQAIPLVDKNQRLSAVAFPQSTECIIQDKVISDSDSVFIIAEIGNNHNGSIDAAKELVDKAVKSGADCVKFQMRDMQELYKNSGDVNDASADLGAQYTLDLLSKFQLKDEELFEVFDYCHGLNVIPLCTPWDMSSFNKLEKYGMQGYKIASADFTNHELIKAVASSGKTLICSTGMSSEQEIKSGVEFLKKQGASFILLHCNSTYPAPFKDINLKYMKHLKELSNGLIGYSGHERDVYVSVAAAALGAKVIEKHFTLDRSLEGNDHKVSLLPDEFEAMVKGIRQVEMSLGTSDERTVTQGELMNRENLAKSLVASVDIPAGVKVTEDMVKVQSPGQGLQPNRISDLVGSKLSKSKIAGEFFFPSDLAESVVVADSYKFNRPWGVPVRYHDMHMIRAMTDMDLLEVHLSYKDMELDLSEFFDEPLDLALVVHAPELFAGDHTLDLCSKDELYRQRSIFEMQRVIDLSRKLSSYFKKTETPNIVTNVGGFSQDSHIIFEDRAELYEILEKSLSELDTSGVNLIPQTMPPFPWHFGGQQFHNLFVDAESIVEFCERNKLSICLDTSHSVLACNYNKTSFLNFVEKVCPYVAHMHLADGKGVDGEGIQIGEGDVQWFDFWTLIDRCCPDASFIPEIWQGHKNQNEGAWIALSRLRKFSCSKS